MSFLRRLFPRADPTPAGGRDPIPVVLYTRAACPLCEEMKAELARARPRRAWRLEEVDIDGEPGLRQRYGLSVPVLSILGRPAFKGRLTAADFERKLERRAREAEREAR